MRIKSHFGVFLAKNYYKIVFWDIFLRKFNKNRVLGCIWGVLAGVVEAKIAARAKGARSNFCDSPRPGAPGGWFILLKSTFKKSKLSKKSKV